MISLVSNVQQLETLLVPNVKEMMVFISDNVSIHAQMDIILKKMNVNSVMLVVKLVMDQLTKTVYLVMKPNTYKDQNV